MIWWDHRWCAPQLSEFVLCCPLCHEQFLHQTAVEAFFREEDAKEGVHAVVDAAGIRHDRNVERNPSGRRDGIRIKFWCECCHSGYDPENEPGPLFLCVVQHKGNTMIYWEREHPVTA